MQKSLCFNMFAKYEICFESMLNNFYQIVFPRNKEHLSFLQAMCHCIGIF